MIRSSQVFLLPGFDGTGELFAPLQDALGSSVPTTPIRYLHEVKFNDYVESVASLLPAQNVVLVAESFSGPVAIQLMARYPQRIQCAILCATFAVAPFRFLTRLARFMPAALFAPNFTQATMLRNFCFDQQTDPAIMTKALAVIRSVPATTLKARLNVLANVAVRSLLGQVKAPVLYLQASQDRIVAAHLSRQLVRDLPNVTVRKIDGPHLLLQSRPMECAKAIVPFIASNISFNSNT